VQLGVPEIVIFMFVGCVLCAVIWIMTRSEHEPPRRPVHDHIVTFPSAGWFVVLAVNEPLDSVGCNWSEPAHLGAVTVVQAEVPEMRVGLAVEPGKYWLYGVKTENHVELIGAIDAVDAAIASGAVFELGRLRVAPSEG
jgi:hypothetical protein